MRFLIMLLLAIPFTLNAEPNREEVSDTLPFFVKKQKQHKLLIKLQKDGFTYQYCCSYVEQRTGYMVYKDCITNIFGNQHYDLVSPGDAIAEVKEVDNCEK